MPRILAIDYGVRRTGLAWTDPLQLIACRLEGTPTPDLLPKLAAWIAAGEVEAVVLGLPTRLDESDTHATPAVRLLATHIETTWPHIALHLVDERFTSVLARRALLEAGVKKKRRQDKTLVDGMAATLLLQQFLEARGNGRVNV